MLMRTTLAVMRYPCSQHCLRDILYGLLYKVLILWLCQGVLRVSEIRAIYILLQSTINIRLHTKAPNGYDSVASLWFWRHRSAC